VTLFASEARRTDALVRVNQIGTDATVDAWAGSAFVNVYFAVNTRVTWHANASESAALVQTGAVVLARIRVAFVDVDLAARSGESARAVALERSGSVDAQSVVFARRAGFAFVDVFRAVHSFEAVGTRTQVGAVDGTRFATGTGVARIRGASVVQMTQQTSFAWGTLAVEAADTIVTGGAIEASGTGAVINVLRTISSGPSVDANARISAVRVDASGSVFADGRPQSALVHVLIAVRARERRRALTRVTVDPVHTRSSVLAQMSGAVVDVLLTVGSSKTWRASAFVVEGIDGFAGSTILARRRAAWNVLVLAVLSGVSNVAVALVRSVRVDTSSVDAGILLALVDIDGAIVSGESGRARALVRVRQGRASGSVLARLQGAVIDRLAA